jgi:hypothetical protein
VTTANQWFPAVAHDTRLPFCHWLPILWRRIYARLCGRAHCELDNPFWSRSLERQLHGFRCVSRFLHYAALENYLATYPFWLTYGKGVDQCQLRIGRAKRAWHTLAAPAWYKVRLDPSVPRGSVPPRSGARWDRRAVSGRVVGVERPPGFGARTSSTTVSVGHLR